MKTFFVAKKKLRQIVMPINLLQNFTFPSNIYQAYLIKHLLVRKLKFYKTEITSAENAMTKFFRFFRRRKG